MLDNFIADVKHWAARPYREDGNVVDWFLFFGLMVAVSVLWSRVIARILD